MRRIKRNILKKSVGSNKIRMSWRKMQINKFGEWHWLWLYNSCVGRLAKSEIYYM